jgi:hypothetical protein
MPKINPKTVQSAINLYKTDFYAWTQEQALLLRNQEWGQIDLPNLIEEIESLGKQQHQELRNRLSILLGHLLKWQYQPQYRSRSWLATIRIQRLELLNCWKIIPVSSRIWRKHLAKHILKVLNWLWEKQIYLS